MNTLSSVSNHLFTAALIENSGGRRRGPRSEKPVTIELARQEFDAERRRQPLALAKQATPREVRFDSRLRA